MVGAKVGFKASPRNPLMLDSNDAGATDHNQTKATSRMLPNFTEEDDYYNRESHFSMSKQENSSLVPIDRFID
jgi:hypothetical protein